MAKAIDEKAARRFAESKGLKIVGVLGILVSAKRKGLVLELRPIIFELKSQANFWLSDALCNKVLSSVGEQPI